MTPIERSMARPTDWFTLGCTTSSAAMVANTGSSPCTNRLAAAQARIIATAVFTTCRNGARELARMVFGRAIAAGSRRAVELLRATPQRYPEPSARRVPGVRRRRAFESRAPRRTELAERLRHRTAVVAAPGADDAAAGDDDRLEDTVAAGHDELEMTLVEDGGAVLVAEQVLVERGQQVHRLALGARRRRGRRTV